VFIKKAIMFLSHLGTLFALNLYLSSSVYYLRKKRLAMKFDKFTLKAQEALATAQQIVMAKSHTIMSPLHLLSAVCNDDAGVAVEILKKIGANVGRIKEMVESEKQ
jgi:hypothetical protein